MTEFADWLEKAREDPRYGYKVCPKCHHHSLVDAGSSVVCHCRAWPFGGCKCEYRSEKQKDRSGRSVKDKMLSMLKRSTKK
jgi:hypothetical protein